MKVYSVKWLGENNMEGYVNRKWYGIIPGVARRGNMKCLWKLANINIRAIT